MCRDIEAFLEACGSKGNPGMIRLTMLLGGVILVYKVLVVMACTMLPLPT